MLKNGDLSWVVPGAIIAFSSPTGSGGYGRSFYSGALGFSPDELIDSFHDLNVKGVIRLNDKLYDANQFEKNGVSVHEMEFPDGSCPKDHIITDFVSLTDGYIKNNQAVAVHCRAGLGRTGTLIGLYIMHKYGFDPKPLIGWMRLCRVGMVVGEQQQFLVRTEGRLSQVLASRARTSYQYADRDNGYNSTPQKSPTYTHSRPLTSYGESRVSTDAYSSSRIQTP